MKKLSCIILAIMALTIAFIPMGSALAATPVKEVHEDMVPQDGYVQNGWVKVYDNRASNEPMSLYFFTKGRKSVNCWQRVDGKSYYFDGQGRAVRRMYIIKRVPYFFGEDFALVRSSWIPPSDFSQESGTMYAKADGTLCWTEWHYIDGKWWFFEGNYYRYTSQATKPSGSSTVFGSLKFGWFKEGGKWYFYSGGFYGTSKYSHWLDHIRKTYYLDPDNGGAMITGWRYMPRRLRNPGEEGMDMPSYWFYFDKSGAMATGWAKVGGKWYYMNDDGHMQTGWLKDGGSWYYLESSGAMATGWKKVGAKWYYMLSNGKMATGTITVSGNRHSFDSSGAWIS